MNPDETYPLVPLGIGEMLDRSVTMALRNFWLFLLLAAVVQVPLIALGYVVGAPFSEMQKHVHSAGGGMAATSAVVLAYARRPDGLALGIAYWLLMFLGNSLAFGAFVAAVAALYERRPVDVRAAYRAAWRRAPRLATITLVVLVAGSVPFLTLLIVLAIVTILPLAWVALLHIGSLTFLAATLLGGSAAMVLLFGLACIVLFENYALADAMLTGRGFADSLGESWRRTLAYGNRRRALKLALSNFALAAGLLVFVLMITATCQAFRSPDWFSDSVGNITGVLVTIVQSIFPIVAYFDFRVRREGYDLERELMQSLERTAAVPSV